MTHSPSAHKLWNGSPHEYRSPQGTLCSDAESSQANLAHSANFINNKKRKYYYFFQENCQLIMTIQTQQFKWTISINFLVDNQLSSPRIPCRNSVSHYPISSPQQQTLHQNWLCTHTQTHQLQAASDSPSWIVLCSDSFHIPFQTDLILFLYGHLIIL